MTDSTKLFVGVDLGDRSSLACVYSGGKVVQWFEFPMTPLGVRQAFEGKGFSKIALEAGAQSAWVSQLLASLGYVVVVANPRKLKAISANERKSDKRDALLLAKLLAADASLLHPIWHRSEAHALALSVLRARDTAVTARVRLINTVRSMSKAMGVRLKKGSAPGFALREDEVPTTLAPVVAPLFVVLRSLNEQIAAYDKQLEHMVEVSFPQAQRLLQVRGVGAISALAFVLTLEDPGRFANGRTAAAFLGLVPRRDQSGDSDRQLRISKTGSNLVRRLLVQCAHYILGPFGEDCDLRRWGFALMERGGKNAKKRAIVATARKLAVLLFRLWKTGERYVPLFNAESALRIAEAVVECPEPAVPADCACHLDATDLRERRGIDCNAADGSDPSMHGPNSGHSNSADRSVGTGTTAATKAKKTKKTPTRSRARASARVPAPPAPAVPAASAQPASGRTAPEPAVTVRPEEARSERNNAEKKARSRAKKKVVHHAESA